MKVQAININNYKQNNPNFKANLQFVGEAKQLLPKGGLERLNNIAKQIGTDKDSILIGVYKTALFDREWIDPLWGNSYERKIFNGIGTKIMTQHIFPSIKNAGKFEESIIEGRLKNRKVAAYKTLYKYLTDLKDKL